jgi:hypothetical protein
MTASTRQVAGDHYRYYPIQPAEFIQKNRIGFLEGNVIKYVCRHRLKNGRQDIEKAIHYLQLLLEWEYGNDQPVPSSPVPRPLIRHSAPDGLDGPINDGRCMACEDD